MRCLLAPFRRIGGQLAGLIVVALLAVHLIVTVAFLIERGRGPDVDGDPNTLVSIARLIAATPPDLRAAEIGRWQAIFPRHRLAVAAFPADRGAYRAPIAGFLRERLGPGFDVVARNSPGPEGEDGHEVAIRLPDGFAFGAWAHERRLPRVGPLAISLIFIALSFTLLGAWAAISLTRPLTRLAHAAESFDPDRGAAPIPEEGPDEVRNLAGAFNRMRDRIGRLIEDRTRMLAAVGHDLRTPLTRLRLRAEFVDNDQIRTALLADLDHMGKMVENALEFLRNGRITSEKVLVDLPALLDTIVDRFVDIGKDVHYVGPGRLSLRIRPEDIDRAITNLVENAVKYGSKAEIRLQVGPAHATVEVVDDGPGVAAEDRDAVLEPFVRGDAARTLDDDRSGFGLGLSIARAVAEAHAGRLELADAPGGGLIARMTLPLGYRS